MTEAPLWRMPGEVEIYGERLRDARVIQKLKAGAVAQSAGVSPERYSRLENEISSTVAESRARELAMAVGFPLDYLAARPVTPVQRGSLLFRARKGMTRGEEDQMVAWCRLIGDMLTSSAAHLRMPYVKTPRPGGVLGPAEAAALTRQSLGVKPYEPIAHLVRVLERGGVYVSRLEFVAELHARHHDALSTWVGPAINWPLVVVRGSAGWERSRLSVAHELGHLVLHHSRRDGDLESEAFEFAAEFLLPTPMLLKEWPAQTTVLSLMGLKRRWGMSLAALVEHGYRHALIDTESRTSLYKQLSNRRDRSTGQSWRVAEPGWNELKPERPKLIGKVIETAFEKAGSPEELSESVYHWRPDLLRQVMVGQATEWSRALVADEAPTLTDPAHDLAGAPLAEVVPLRRRA